MALDGLAWRGGGTWCGSGLGGGSKAAERQIPPAALQRWDCRGLAAFPEASWLPAAAVVLN